MPTVTASLAGVWQSDDGAILSIAQSPGSASVTSTVLNDTCTGGPRTSFITGDIGETLNGSTLNGTMDRCSPSDSFLVTNCSLPAIWSTPFNATINEVQGQYPEIDGHYQSQYWKWNVTNGTVTNCHIDHYLNSTFSLFRIDCGIRSFDSLAIQYISDSSLRPAAIALAQQFENGAKLSWTAAQLVPGGFKSHVLAFEANLSSFGYQSTVISAYRPLLYQAHFADFHNCLLDMLQTVQNAPMLAPFLADSVKAVDQAVYSHVLTVPNQFSGDYGNVTASGILFSVPRICWHPPLTQCDHVNQRAVDISISLAPGPQPPAYLRTSTDFVGALSGFCRTPTTIVNDPNHWVYFGPNPWTSPMCIAAGNLPTNTSAIPDVDVVGNSPINLLVTDPSGQRVGFAPSTGSVVNDFGPGVAFYSGPSTHPQIIRIGGNGTVAGNFSVTGVGTGSGSYTISVTVLDADGGVLATENYLGQASNRTAIASVQYNLLGTYSSPAVLTPATRGASNSGTTEYSLRVSNGSYALSVAGAGIGALMFCPTSATLALEPSASGGTSTVTIPGSLLIGPFSVRADGAPIAFTTSNTSSGTAITFDVPANASFVSIQGSPPVAAVAPHSSGFPWAAPLAVGAVLVAAGVGVAYVWRRRSSRRPPPPAAGNSV